MRPQAQLEVQAPRHSLVADKAQHLQVVVALSVGKSDRANVIPRHREQKWIREVKVAIGNVAREVVA